MTLVLAASGLFSFGCHSSSRQLVGPSGTKCEVSVPGSLPSVGADGGAGTLSISAARECAWSVASGAPWLSITSDRSGQGPGVVSYTAAVNPTPVSRRGALTVADHQIEILQDAAPCHFTFTPTALSVEAEGGESLVTVNAISGCAWTAVSEASWIAIAGAADGSGTGSVRVQIAPNSGGERTGRIWFAGLAYTVTQHPAMAPQCSATLAAPVGAVTASGTTVIVGVNVPGGCGWTASSQVPWIHVSRGSDGVGAGTVELSVARNTGGERSGLVSIAGQTFAVTQAAASSPQPPCSFALGSVTQTVPSVGGDVTVAVSTSSGCTWTATSQVAWITVTSGAAGTGNGTMTLAVATNAGGQRSGAVTIAGQTLTVTQAPGGSTPTCSYSLASNAQSAPASGGLLSVNVSAGNGCPWTAASQTPWIAVTTGAQGNGNGTVTLTIAVNSGSERSGSVTIAGQTLAVTQGGVSQDPAPAPTPCVYNLSPAGAEIGATDGALAASVTTPAACAWTASSQATWITVVSGASGSGNGTVSLHVAANTGDQRTGTVAVAGHTLTVTQAAAQPRACTFSINPTEQAASSLGGTYSAAVTTQSGCTWTATANVPWVEINGSRGGTGSGTVTYRVSIGTVIFSREGTLTVAGQTLTVSQAGLLITGGQ